MTGWIKKRSVSRVSVSGVCGLAMLAAATLGSAGVLAPSIAQAQEPMQEQVDAGPKGAVGLGLIGAELGLVIPAVSGLHEIWSFIVFPVAGAAGGAVAGHFLVDDNNKRNASVSLLAVGLALAVPAVVLTLVSTAYDPDDEPTVETPGGTQAAAKSSQGSSARSSSARDSKRMASRRRSARIARAGGGAVRLSEEGLLLAPPAFVVGAPPLTQLAAGTQPGGLRAQAGELTGRGVHVSLVSGVF